MDTELADRVHRFTSERGFLIEFQREIDTVDESASG